MLTNVRIKRTFQSISPYLCGLLLPLSAIGLRPGFAIASTPILIEPTLASAEIIKATQSEGNLLVQGRLAYQAGRYTEAKTLWQEVYKESQAQENNLAQAQTLNYLALTSHKLGEWQVAEKYLAQSLEILQEHESDPDSLKIKAQTLNTLGRIKLGMGQPEAALASWQQATKIYQQAGDEVGAFGVEINQAQAWQSLGLYRRAQKSLQQIANKFDQLSDPTLKITGLRSLGIALQVTGDLQAAQEILNQSLLLSQKLNLSEESSTTLFSLGNTALALANPTQATTFYQQAASTTSQPLLKTEAQLNQLGLLISTEQWQPASNLLSEIQTNLVALSPTSSRRLIYARVNLAKHIIELANHTTDNKYLAQTKELLKTSIEQARQLEDPQAESYAVGMLGHLYEEQQQLSLGRKYTQQAVQVAQVINNSDLTYQWQWQLGRLLKNQGNQPGAIASYTEAVNALESLRGDLVVTNTDVQFSFRESIEPVYRELVSLLLSPENNQPVSQDNLLQARNTIESLQLAELNNFFREACLDATPKAIEEIDRQAAVVYPIILRDRLEVIISLPDKSLRHYSQAIPQAELDPVIDELRQTLQIRSRRQFFAPAQKLYSLLIRPALSELAQYNIKTLVFVPDGAFRNIPFATLHDGEQYLIEQYNVALTPGLQLLAPQPLEEVELKTLAAGITQQRRGFASLEYVNQELIDIQNQTDSVVLRDDQFTKKSLEAKIQTAQYPIVHIATHGQFSSNLEDTFLLTWDSEINIGELEELLDSSDSNNRQQAIELLILSACETARGDNRAALGLAGMSVRAGARTTLATLWAVYDESTALTMNNFYQNITQTQDKRNKAEALRQAQINLINSPQFRHPYYWSPFVMLGNWL
ncbi:CHAT domain-containing protein [Pleurocapsa sp. PCC 7319]|uniref:CHAT domain-containing protein n=1 Tax=Pleurocapsa sp. PCC 7319 TaxID=118161 RepID=UPI00034B72BE|nr:CHAT domain-containing protein [Pleurocapsa sp. PCC 7319]